MLTINAMVRKDFGKGASRRLRLSNKFPAIIYGGAEKKPIAIELDHDIVMQIQTKEGFFTDVITLVIDGKENNVKVQSVQRHPFKIKIIHIDFIRI